VAFFCEFSTKIIFKKKLLVGLSLNYIILESIIVDYFRKSRRSMLRDTASLDISALLPPTQAIKPLRLKYKQVCELLNVSRDCLRKIMESDQSFPKPLKSGSSRQSAVYFDTEEIEVWYAKQKEKCRREQMRS